MQRNTHKKRGYIIAISLILMGVAFYIFWLSTNATPSAPPTNESSNENSHTEETAFTCTNNLPDTVLLGQKIMIAAYTEQLNEIQENVTSASLNGILAMDEIPAAAIQNFVHEQAITPTVATDQEGGTVQRYKANGELPGAEKVAATLSLSEAYTLYLNDALYLKNIGITTNFAPVVDVASAVPNPLPGRMYSSNPDTVTAYASQFIKASRKAGITPVIKHFPGLGSASGNTDKQAATTDTYEQLKTRDLLPYASLSSLNPDVMVNNAIIPDLSKGQPAIWSPEVVSLLREYGYQHSVVYSDSLTAKAIPGSLSTAALKAWNAGVDVVVIVQTKDELPSLSSNIANIVSESKTALQSGELSRKSLVESVVRILSRKGVNPCSIQTN